MELSWTFAGLVYIIIGTICGGVVFIVSKLFDFDKEYTLLKLFIITWATILFWPFFIIHMSKSKEK